MLEEDGYLRDVNYDIIRDIVYTVLIKRVYSSIINNSRVNNIKIQSMDRCRMDSRQDRISWRRHQSVPFVNLSQELTHGWVGL